MLTEQQRRLLNFIENTIREKGVAPSFEGMAVALGLRSKSGVHRLLTCLEERGFIVRLPHRARAIDLMPMNRRSCGDILRAARAVEEAILDHLSGETPAWLSGKMADLKSAIERAEGLA